MIDLENRNQNNSNSENKNPENNSIHKTDFQNHQNANSTPEIFEIAKENSPNQKFSAFNPTNLNKDDNFKKTTKIAGTLFLIAILLFILNFGLKKINEYKYGNVSQNTIIFAKINDIPFVLEVANTPDKRAKGLSGRRALTDKHGLFMIFEKADKHGIWMKGMLFPLDILWLDQNFSIVDLKTDVAIETYPEVFYPENDSVFVIELPAGSVQNYSLSIGQKINFNPDKTLN